MLSIFAALFVFAEEGVSPASSFLGTSIYMDEIIGPVLFGRVLHAWVLLIASVIIFTLVLKYMKGGYLARPLLLIGFGILVSALLGISVPPSVYISWTWVGDIVISVCVIVAIFWIERLFTATRS